MEDLLLVTVGGGNKAAASFCGCFTFGFRPRFLAADWRTLSAELMMSITLSFTVVVAVLLPCQNACEIYFRMSKSSYQIFQIM